MFNRLFADMQITLDTETRVKLTALDSEDINEADSKPEVLTPERKNRSNDGKPFET
jgi:hypothetical protein